MVETENTGSAGPALAAHSKDAAAEGQTPASAAMPQASRGTRNAICSVMDELCGLMREKPLTAAAVLLMLGIVIGKSRRH